MPIRSALDTLVTGQITSSVVYDSMNGAELRPWLVWPTPIYLFVYYAYFDDLSH